MAGYGPLRSLDERGQPGQRRAVAVERATRAERRDLHVGQVVATHENLDVRGEDRHPVGRMAASRVQLEVLVADLEMTGHRQLLHRPEPERTRSPHVVLAVRLAELALNGARRRAEALRRRLRHPERELREGE